MTEKMNTGEGGDSLDFKIEGIINWYGEVHTVINGKRYVYNIDAALIPKLRTLYKHSPGKALQFLKERSTGYWRSDECSTNGKSGRRMQP